MIGANRAVPESHRKGKNYLDIPSLLPTNYLYDFNT